MDKRLFRILLILSLLSAAGGLILYPRLPDVVPIQWDMQGQPTNYGPKYLALVLPVVATIGMHLLPRLDPRGANHRKSPRAYNVISAAIVVMLLSMGWLSFLPFLGIALPVGKLVGAALGVLFIIMGNYMPQVRSNYFLGIRTPWALSNETVWRKTHRAGGIAFCVLGALMVLGVFLPQLPLQRLSVILLLLTMAGVYVYSYLVYKRLPKDGAGPRPTE